MSETIAFLTERKRAYELFAGSPAGKAVLADLARFCRADATCVKVAQNGAIDRERTFLLEGRREVWLRIQEHLNHTPEELAELYGAVAPNQDTDR